MALELGRSGTYQDQAFGEVMVYEQGIGLVMLEQLVGDNPQTTMFWELVDWDVEVDLTQYELPDSAIPLDPVLPTDPSNPYGTPDPNDRT